MDEKKVLKSGTTIVGMVTKDAVYLGCDLQVTSGMHIASEVERKIYKISDNLGVAIAGNVGDALSLIRFLEAYVNKYEIEYERKMTPKALTNLLGHILNGNRYFPFLVGFIVGGFNKEGHLYTLDAIGGIVKEKNYTADGSGGELALSVLHTGYKKDLKEKEAKELIKKAIMASKKFDTFSGGEKILVVKIDKNGYKEEYI